MAIYNWVNISSGKDLLPDGTKPLPESMLMLTSSHEGNFIGNIKGTIIKICRKIGHLKLQSNLPGDNELIMHYKQVVNLMPSHYLKQYWHAPNCKQNASQNVLCKMLTNLFRLQRVNSWWPSDAIWRHRSGSTLAKVMACCLMAPSHYLY